MTVFKCPVPKRPHTEAFAWFCFAIIRHWPRSVYCVLSIALRIIDRVIAPRAGMLTFLQVNRGRGQGRIGPPVLRSMTEDNSLVPGGPLKWGPIELKNEKLKNKQRL